jgi:hypothetical protein
MKRISGLVFSFLFLFHASFASGTETTSAQTAAIKVVDTTPAFWNFWDAAQGKSEEQRVRLFAEMVVKPNPELYDAQVMNKQALAGTQASPDANTLIAKYLNDVTEYIPRMRIISDSIHHDFQAYANDFMLTFPTYSPKTTVYFMVSLFSFDGGTRTVNDKTALLFGIDGIVRYHPSDDNLKVFFDHELFHQYHEQIAPELTDDDAPIWTSLWEEGLATYVSRIMNPGSTEGQALMSPTLAEKSKPILSKIAQELLVNFDSLDKKEYAAFFYGSNGRADLPPRCGYYVGYLVAQQLGTERSLQQLANLRGPELKAAVHSALQRIATPL